ncbi:MAG TPA: alpha-hydroxy acid oxidase [Gaiellaceae bacterium]|nr:alpha-hydroxy acid oxidase [Gaiellaceae bacterium]
MGEPLCVADWEALAREALDDGCWAYYAGGAGDEWTLAENVAAFRRRVLRPRVLVDVSGASTRTTVLGHELSMPLVVAPVAYQRMAHADGEIGLARAAAAAGTVFTLSTMATTAPDELAAAAPEAMRWFQLYVFKDRELTRAIVEEARDAGFSALVVTVDTPRLGSREGQLRSGFSIPTGLGIPALVKVMAAGEQTPQHHFHLISDSVTWRDVEWFASVSSLPVVLKGVMTAEDAVLAVEHGAAALVVSNHGGRQLDGVSATLDALPEVAAAVDGRIEVLVDGGVRRGTDVVKALALGARAVMAGRAPLWGLAAGGELGARRVLEQLREEIELALALVGCAGPDAVGPGHVGRAHALDE